MRIVVLPAAVVLLLQTAAANQHVPTGFPWGTYVGDAACRPCHEEIYRKFQSSRHRLGGAQPATPDKFRGGIGDVLTYVVDGVTYEYELVVEGDTVYMERRADDAEFPVRDRAKIDFVQGSGLKKAQSYVCWPASVAGTHDGIHDPVYFDQEWTGRVLQDCEDERALVMLPVTWIEGEGLAFSPGAQVHLQRDYLPLRKAGWRCLNCHFGYHDRYAPNRFGEMFTHIGCEKCHGPGKDHVDRWEREGRKEPNEKDTELVDETTVHPKYLSRELQIQICAECHSNMCLRPKAPTGVAGLEHLAELPLELALNWYRPGYPLAQFYEVASDPPEYEIINTETELLELSRCFAESPDMTCTTCHDAHSDPTEEERAAFDRDKCRQCHGQRSECAASAWAIEHFKVDSSCYECHMRQVIHAGTRNRNSHRSHHIQRFPE